MKLLALVFMMVLGVYSRAQYIYGSISGGYEILTQLDQPPSYIVNTIHQVYDPWFWGLENMAFKEAAKTDIGFGHLITKNIGYELSGSYLKPFDVGEVNNWGSKELSGEFFQGSANLIINISLKKIELYSALGINLANGKMKFRQTYDEYAPTTSGTKEASLSYEYTSEPFLGASASLGVNLPLTKRIFLFSEISFSNLSFSPKKARIVEYTINGENELSEDKPYYSQIEFGEESEWYYYTSDHTDKPQKLYHREYSLGGYGVTIGLKVVLWRK